MNLYSGSDGYGQPRGYTPLNQIKQMKATFNVTRIYFASPNFDSCELMEKGSCGGTIGNYNDSYCSFTAQKCSIEQWAFSGSMNTDDRGATQNAIDEIKNYNEVEKWLSLGGASQQNWGPILKNAAAFNKLNTTFAGVDFDIEAYDNTINYTDFTNFMGQIKDNFKIAITVGPAVKSVFYKKIIDYVNSINGTLQLMLYSNYMYTTRGNDAGGCTSWEYLNMWMNGCNSSCGSGQTCKNNFSPERIVPLVVVDGPTQISNNLNAGYVQCNDINKWVNVTVVPNVTLNGTCYGQLTQLYDFLPEKFSAVGVWNVPGHNRIKTDNPCPKETTCTSNDCPGTVQQAVENMCSMTKQMKQSDCVKVWGPCNIPCNRWPNSKAATNWPSKTPSNSSEYRCTPLPYSPTPPAPTMPPAPGPTAPTTTPAAPTTTPAAPTTTPAAPTTTPAAPSPASLTTTAVPTTTKPASGTPSPVPARTATRKSYFTPMVVLSALFAVFCVAFIVLMVLYCKQHETVMLLRIRLSQLIAPNHVSRFTIQ